MPGMPKFNHLPAKNEQAVIHTCDFQHGKYPGPERHERRRLNVETTFHIHRLQGMSVCRTNP